MSSNSEASHHQQSPIVKPGGLIAILGGGQLGRMTAMAARTMGYHIRVMDPESACPASFVVDQTIVGRWDDHRAARMLANGADVVTLEIEQIGIDALSSRFASSRTRLCKKPGSPAKAFPSARFAWSAPKPNSTKR